MNEDLRKKIISKDPISDDEWISYFTQDLWGDVYPDDKYYDQHLLEDYFIVFVVHAFAYLNLPRPTRNQLEMARFVADTKNPHRMVMALRGLSKSLMSQLYVIWRLMRDPNEKILVMSGSATRAINYTQFVQKLLKTFPITYDMAPRHNKERTSSQSFDVVGATPSDSPSVYAVGVGNQITGFRATLVIYDDIETANNAASVVQREKVDLFASEAANILMSGKDESITLCTPHSQDSIYIGWLEKGHKAFIIPAEYPSDVNMYGNMLAPHLRDILKKIPALSGTPTDERFPKEVLESKSLRIGRSQYVLQYLLDTSLSDELKYPLKLSDFIVADIDLDKAPNKITYSSMPDNTLFVKHNGFKQDRLYKPAFISEEGRDYEQRVMYVDPSGRGADELGYAIGFMSLGRLFAKEIGGLNGGYDRETLIALLLVAKANKVDTMVIESNFGDGMFKQIIEPLIFELRLDITIEEHRAKGQKEVRIINTLEPLLNQHKIVIDKSIFDKDGKNGINKSFTYQLTHITIDAGSLSHDDRLDAFSGLCEFLSESFNVFANNVLSLEDDEGREKAFNIMFDEIGYNPYEGYATRF
jgi:hypothetical protein